MSSNKLASYNKATQGLMLQAMEYDVESSTNFSLSEMVFLLRESYKYKLTYRKVFNETLAEKCDPATGFCIVSSYYIYERTGGDKVWDIMQTPIHWWLRHKQTGKVFDITYTQFDKPFPYQMGKIEPRIQNDEMFNRILHEKALILGRCAGME